FLYLRVWNHGVTEDGPVTWRLFGVPFGAAPLEIRPSDQLATGVVARIRPGGFEIVEASTAWSPAGAAGAHVAVLVTREGAGDTLRSPFAVPFPDPVRFDDFAALHAYCRTHNNVAYRVFELG